MRLGSSFLRGCVSALALTLAGAAAEPACAALQLSHLLTDHAVIQRDRPIHIWGWATPGAPVTASLEGESATGTADRLGRWSIWLAPHGAGGPYVLSVSGDGGSQTVSDIMLGDLWLASGQSNMEMPLKGFPPTAFVKDAQAEIARADNPRIRLLRLEHRSSPYPLRDVAESWTTCTPQTAASFSAIGYLFAREIAEREHVTVGVIDSTWGGSPAEAWVSERAYGDDPGLTPVFAARADLEAGEAYKDDIVAAEHREDAEARVKGLTPEGHEWRPPEESWRPAGLYNAMIAPLTDAEIKGVIWYQGETNSKADRVPVYERLFKAMISDWRHDFAQGDFPFLFAQISSFDSPQEFWGEARDAERRGLALRDTAIAVTTDVGNPNNVHPSDKQTVAARLALAARGLVYGEDVRYQPPLFRQVTNTADGLRIWFDHADGLTTHGAPVNGFEIAGPDRHFVPARATLDHDTVVVTGPVADPTYARFDWTNVTTGALYNSAGLPSPTFTTEQRLSPTLPER